MCKSWEAPHVELLQLPLVLLEQHPCRLQICTTEKQKPTMTLPDLTEGHQTTLTCSAPALCSTSPPGISWMWRGATLTAVTQRHNSTLTFIPTAELHNSNITCRIRFSDNTTTEETVNLHVNSVDSFKYISAIIPDDGSKQKKICPELCSQLSAFTKLKTF
uniref:Ig-like domain-containing protein n=1 Tax=Oryzias melastigma TaxID=30732 RepID=A0A3B3DXB7_ORYME